MVISASLWLKTGVHKNTSKPLEFELIKPEFSDKFLIRQFLGYSSKDGRCLYKVDDSSSLFSFIDKYLDDYDITLR